MDPFNRHPLGQLGQQTLQEQKKAEAQKRKSLAQALIGPDGYLQDFVRRAGEASQGLGAGMLGAPVDLATMAMRPLGYGVQEPVGGTDWIGRKMGADPSSPSFIAGSMGPAPDAMDLAKLGKLGALAFPGMTVFHGTPHKFPPEPDAPLGKFRLDKIGTGEGAQAYGHGIYVAENPEVAGTYRVADKWAPGGVLEYKVGGETIATANIDEKQILEAAVRGDEEYLGRVYSQANLMAGRSGNSHIITENVQKRDLIEKIRRDGVEAVRGGSLYEVDLPDEQIEKMLDWDKPLSEQPESVRKEVKDLLEHYQLSGSITGSDRTARYVKWSDDMDGAAVMDLLQAKFGKDAASAKLREAGIPGIRYLDAASRGAGEGTRNFVLFDPDIAKITGRK